MEWCAAIGGVGAAQVSEHSLLVPAPGAGWDLCSMETVRFGSELEQTSKLVHYDQSIGRMRPSLVRTCCFVSCLATVDHSQISYRNKFDDAVQAKQHAFLQQLETSLASANQLEGFHPQLAWLRGLSAGTSTECGRTLEDMVGDTGFAGWKLLSGEGSSLRFMHSWGPGIPSGAWRRCGSCSTRAVDLHHRLSGSATFDS